MPTPAYECPSEQQGADTQQSPDPQDSARANQGSQVIEDLSDDRCAHLCTAGVGPRVWHDRFSYLLDLKMLSSAARNRFLAPLMQ